MKFSFLFSFSLYFSLFFNNVITYQTNNEKKLLSTINKFNQNKKKGILAIDESLPTIGKRFFEYNIKNTKFNRMKYRNLLLETPYLKKYASGCILHEETLLQKKNDLQKNNLLLGVKLDNGLMEVDTNKFITKGLDKLEEKCILYKKLGIKFAKWRSVFCVSNNFCDIINIKENCIHLARYTKICQKYDIVPIVEPEILMIGNHSIYETAKFQEYILKTMYSIFNRYNIFLEATILKTNFVCPGIENKKQNIDKLSTKVANLTLKTFEKSVPSNVPIIAMLSGGLSENTASLYLNNLSKMKTNKKWNITFSFGRALQHSCLKAWNGKNKNINKSQQILLQKLIDNNKANIGKYRHHHLDQN